MSRRRSHLQLAEHGIVIGRDVSVIGFDDASAAAANDLTTIRQPVEAMGKIVRSRCHKARPCPHEARFQAAALAPLDVPSWARGAVFYQVFPDRFARGHDAPPCDTYDLEAWDADPTSSGFKGGTLRGITKRLDDLVALGVDAVRLNPVFRSPSNHGYDTIDFFAIEPRLGTAADLRALVDAAHARGMRIVLDGVFNHVSDQHPFFLNVLERGAGSPYWSWFTIWRWPVERRDDDHYAAWWGHGHPLTG